MSAVRARVLADTTAALKAGDRFTVITLRTVAAAIKQVEVDTRTTPDDDAVLAVLNTLLKKSREAEMRFREGKRDDLADKEAAEAVIIERYLPARLSDAEIDAAIQATIHKTQAQSVKDMGNVMATLKDSIGTRADMRTVSQRVKALLAAQQ